MNVTAFLEAMIFNELAKKPDVKKSFEEWKSDPIYDFEDSHLEDLQKMIWEIELLRQDSKELKTYKEAIGYFKELITG